MFVWRARILAGNMRTRTLLLMAILAPWLTAADQEVIETDWTGLRQRLASSASQGRAFRVVLLDGREFRANLVRVEDDALVVRSPGEARIPRAELAAIQQKGKRGRGRLVGTLVGAALMAIAAAVPPGQRIDTLENKRYTRGQAAAFGAAFIPLGYLIGYAVDKPHPELRPVP